MPPEQRPREVSLNVEVTQRQEPHDHLPVSKDITGAVNSARRGVLVCEIPPAEEPAETTPEEHQCVRYQRLNEREESAIRAAAGEV